jgi:hypothetical protein
MWQVDQEMMKVKAAWEHAGAAGDLVIHIPPEREKSSHAQIASGTGFADTVECSHESPAPVPSPR